MYMHSGYQQKNPLRIRGFFTVKVVLYPQPEGRSAPPPTVKQIRPVISGFPGLAAPVLSVQIFRPF